MVDPLILMGFGPSVYTRIVRLALLEMGLTAEYVEVNPFAEVMPPELLAVNPIGRVPVLRHGSFVLSETGAILRYLDGVSDAPSFVPDDLKAMARMSQVMGIVDAHLYVPLVRKVFGHGYFAPRREATHDPDQVVIGLAQTAPAFDLLDRIAAEGLQLTGAGLSLADMHLMPMMEYGMRVHQTRDLLRRYPDLAQWWGRVKDQPALLQTDPLPEP